MPGQAQWLPAITDVHAFQVHLEYGGRHTWADAQNRLHARRHFPWAERLDHIIVGTRSPGPPRIISASRALRNITGTSLKTAQLLAGFKAVVISGKPMSRMIRSAGVWRCWPTPPGRGPGGGEAPRRGGRNQRVGYRRLLLDNQDMRHGFNQQSGLSAVYRRAGLPPRRIHAKALALISSGS